MDIPSNIRAGDSLSWTETITDYPASSGYTLHYKLSGPAQITLDSEADEAAHAFEILATATAQYTPGVYTVAQYVTKDDERFTLDEGTVTILPDLVAMTGSHDGRSFARKALETIEATIEKNLRKDAQSLSEAAISVGYRTWTEMLAARSKLMVEVKAEDDAAKLRAGMGTGRTILTRRQSAR